MSLSEAQHSALLEAKHLLEDVGLDTPAESHPGYLSRLISDHLFNATATPILSARNLYNPPPARNFTAEELAAKKDRVTRQTRASAIVKHPLGSIVEYPETGADTNKSVTHVFAVDPGNLVHPKLNFQYSLGDSQGIRKNVGCKSDFLVDDNTGLPATCKVESISCK
jgi:hypothetical protein